MTRHPARASWRASRRAALTSDAIVHQRVGGAAHEAPAGARAGRRVPAATVDAPAAGARHGSRRGAPGAARPSRPVLAGVGHDAVRPDRWRRHARGQRARRGRPAGQGHDQGPGHGHRCRGARRAHRPVAGCRAGRRRVHPQRRGHRRAAAGRDQLPQLRQTRAARGVLAAAARPCAAWATRAARWACPSPAATSASTTSRRDGRHRADRQIGVVGLLDDIGRARRARFPAVRATCIALLGETGPGMAGSIYADIAGAAPDDRPPALDLVREAALQELLPAARGCGAARAAQDVSGGGLAVALAEMCLWAGVGADLSSRVGVRPRDRPLRRGPQPRVVSVAPDRLERARGARVECRRAAARPGPVGGDRLRIRLVGHGATGAAEERGAGVADDLDEPLDVLREPGRRPAARPRRRRLATRTQRSGGLGHVRRRRRPCARPGRRTTRRAGAVRAPAPRPGIGRRRRQRRRRA